VCWLQTSLFWLGSSAPEICQTLGMRLFQDHVACPKLATQSHLPSGHCNFITHWSHMEEMKWFSSAMLGVGVLAANILVLAWLCS
jgi:hypothetical protein